MFFVLKFELILIIGSNNVLTEGARKVYIAGAALDRAATAAWSLSYGGLVGGGGRLSWHSAALSILPSLLEMFVYLKESAFRLCLLTHLHLSSRRGT
jgi:hypothetical protein